MKSNVVFAAAGAHTMKCKVIPIGRNVRSEHDALVRFIHREPKHSADCRAKHHCRGPYLVRRGCSKSFIVSTREDFGHMAERSIQSEQSICAQIRICLERPMVAVLSDRGPASEQRPYRTVVIPGGSIQRIPLRDDAHSPISSLIPTGEMIDGGVRLLRIEDIEP